MMEQAYSRLLHRAINRWVKRNWFSYFGYLTLRHNTTHGDSYLPDYAAAGVAANSAITAVFSEALSPSTVTNATFTLMQGTTLVTGTVTYAGVYGELLPQQLI